MRSGRKRNREAAPLKTQVLLLLLGSVLPLFIGMSVINAVELNVIRDQIYATSQDALSGNMRIFDGELKAASMSMVGLDYNENTVAQFQSASSDDQYYAGTSYLHDIAQFSSSLVTGYGVFCPENGNLVYSFSDENSTGYAQRTAFLLMLRDNPDVLKGGKWRAAVHHGVWFLVYGYQLRETWFFCWAEVDYLSRLTDGWLTTEDGGVVLLNAAGLEMTRSSGIDGLVLPRLSSEKYKIEGRYLLFSETSETGAYTLAEAVNIRELTQPVRWVQTALAAVLIAFLACLPFLVHNLNRRFFAPMDQLQYAIGRVNKGLLDYRIPQDNSSIEFHRLIDSFNGMVSQIKDLKVQAYEDEIEKNRIRMQYMQVQIEPHFYLNALNTINAMAQVGDDGPIQQLTRCLSDYMRFIASSRETVTIREELRNIGNYLTIMKIRRGDSFTFTVRCEPELENAPIPPLLIQTLIENIMKYAFNAYGETTFSVEIARMRLDGKVGAGITVSDSGPGYPPDFAALFNAGGGMEGHIGLQNARTRLRYLYADAVFQIGGGRNGARTFIWFPLDGRRNDK